VLREPVELDVGEGRLAVALLFAPSLCSARCVFGTGQRRHLRPRD
jgi:hypothetical protein